MEGGDTLVMPHQAKVGQRKLKKPPQSKHVPVRTCVSCREPGAKRELTRIVRISEGNVEIDATGKKNGRGAYLCEKPACWRSAIESPVLSRALKIPLSPASVERLKEHAATLRDLSGDELSAAQAERIIE